MVFGVRSFCRSMRSTCFAFHGDSSTCHLRESWTTSIARVEPINKRLPFQLGKGDLRSLTARTFDFPVTSAPCQPHLTSITPPLIDLSWKSNPDLALGPQICEIGEQ